MIQERIAEKLLINEADKAYKILKRSSWVLIGDIIIRGKISHTYSILNIYNITDNIIKYINTVENKISLSTFFAIELISFYDPESTLSMVNKRKIFMCLYHKVRFKPKWVIKLWTKVLYRRTIDVILVNNNHKYFFSYQY